MDSYQARGTQALSAAREGYQISFYNNIIQWVRKIFLPPAGGNALQSSSINYRNGGEQVMPPSLLARAVMGLKKIQLGISNLSAPSVLLRRFLPLAVSSVKPSLSDQPQQIQVESRSDAEQGYRAFLASKWPGVEQVVPVETERTDAPNGQVSVHHLPVIPSLPAIDISELARLSFGSVMAARQTAVVKSDLAKPSPVAKVSEELTVRAPGHRKVFWSDADLARRSASVGNGGAQGSCEPQRSVDSRAYAEAIRDASLKTAYLKTFRLTP